MRHDWPRLWASHSLIALSTSTARARNCIAPEPQMTIDTSHLPSGPPGPPGPCQARKEMLLGGLGLSLRTSGITAKEWKYPTDWRPVLCKSLLPPPGPNVLGQRRL